MNTKKYSFYRALILSLLLITDFAHMQAQSTGQHEPELKNPFSFKSVELPDDDSWPGQCTTYFPLFIEEDVLKEIIRAVMKSEGLTLSINQIWKGKSGELYLEGLDTVSGIGYAVINYTTMGWGTMPSFGYSSYFEQKRSVKDQMDTFCSNEKTCQQLLKAWEERSLLDKIPEHRRQQYMEINDVFRSGKKPERIVMENLFLESYFLHPPSPWLTPPEQLVNQIFNQLQGVERTRLLAALFELDQQGAFYYKVDSLDFCGAGAKVNTYLFEQIMENMHYGNASSEVLKTKKLLENIIGMDLYDGFGQKIKREFINCIRNWKTEIPTDSLFYYSQIIDRRLISVDEIYEMTEHAGQNGLYIIPLNSESLDQAFISRELIDQCLSQISEKVPFRNKKVWEAYNQQAEKQFEEKVRTYIHWARQQSIK